jgi:HD-GYP domain-containing protein (c-di-GMP phosphodiesterase class II)
MIKTKGRSAVKSAEIEEYKERLALLYKVGQKASLVSRVSSLLDQISLMTRQTLRASAASVLLVNGEEGELHFKVAQGKAGKALKKMKLTVNSGISGWVARNGKPLMVNDVASDKRFNKNIDKVTGFNTKSILAVPLVSERSIIGVIEVLNKVDGSKFNKQDLEVLVALASTAAIAISNARLHQKVLGDHKNTVKALAAAVDARDHYTCGHSQRVTKYALLGGSELSLPAEELEVIEYAGILHDIGKIGISDAILCKPSRLTDEEWLIMRQHPEIGAKILEGIPFLEKARELVLYHHERYDGKGYPEGLAGRGIPIGARLIAIADAFDTMTTDRAYRPALGIGYAVRELYKCSGTQFCPRAVKAFISGLKTQGVLAQPNLEALPINKKLELSLAKL